MAAGVTRYNLRGPWELERFQTNPDGSLKDGQISYDWKEVEARADLMPDAVVDISEGVIDEAMRAMCAEALRTLGSVVDLLELTTDGVARFRYYGPIKYKIGIEAMAGQLLLEAADERRDARRPRRAGERGARRRGARVERRRRDVDRHVRRRVGERQRRVGRSWHPPGQNTR